MKTLILLFFLTLFISILTLHADERNGKIMGKVYDASNGSVLPEAVVKLENLNKSTASDLDGKFEIDNVQAGRYNLKVTYIGYVQKKIDVELKPSEVVNVDVILEPESTATDTINIEAVRKQNNEAGLLIKQQKSGNILDGISEQQIKRAPDAVASEVLRRVTGVSIVNDKYVYVRGTSDRYSLTTLNGALVPSSEPDKKAFSFDLFPSNLIDNIVISKSYTPDQPGNFSGGLLQVTTKDFPDVFTMNYSITGGLNTSTTGKDFLTYNAGQSKILFINSGYDDGLRGLPSIFPGKRVIDSYFSNQELKAFGKSFRNNWGQNIISAPYNGGFQFSIGNKFSLFKKPLGILFAYTYKNSFSNEDINRNRYNTDLSPLEEFTGKESKYSVLSGGLLNLIYKPSEYHKISIKNTYSLNSDDITSYLNGWKEMPSEVNDYKLYQTRFTQRSLISSQLTGEHFLQNFGKISLNWLASYSESRRYEPDQKSMTYQRERFSTDPYFARLSTIANNDAGDRYFADLKDINRNGVIDISIPFFRFDGISQSKIKTGIFASLTTRSFRARDFAPRNLGSYLIVYESLDSIFMPENIDTNKLVYQEITRESDAYNAKDENYAGYLTFDIPVKKLRINAGFRFEYNRQKVSSLGLILEPITADLKNNDILPSVNLTYSINDRMNIRSSFSQTVSRPELREISPNDYYDFTYGVDIGGNPKLHRNLIQNYDLRYEFFPAPSEIITFSMFYKHFDSPIEQVFKLGANNPAITFQNAENGARNYGIEIELRKNLGFLSKYLADISFNGNLALINSKVNVQNTSATYTERKMQGQSPYTLNLGIYYDNLRLGTSVNVVYNKFGKRVSQVGLNGFNDIEEAGNDIVDITISQKLFKYFEMKFSAKDIINQDKTFEQKVGDEIKTVRKYKSGTNYSLTASYKF